MKRVLIVLAGLILISLQGYASGLCIADPSCLISDDGVFSNASDVWARTFTLTGPALVEMRTWGFGGGVNLDGDVIPEGGFDPVLSLYDGAYAGSRIAQNDDGGCGDTGINPSGGLCWDSFIQMPLAAGTYTLVLTPFANFPGATWGSYSGTPSFSGRTEAYAVDAELIPEPMTFVLIGTGLLGLGILGRRRARK